MTKRIQKNTLADRFMAEVINLGGLPLTRADAYALLKADGHDNRTADYFAFKPQPLVGVEPMALDAAKAIVIREAA